MAIASNFPAIRPSLNLDFANARTLDPRITFSRASAATYYDGRTVAKAEENLLAYSQNFIAGWARNTTVLSSTELAPDSSLTASLIIPSISGIRASMLRSGMVAGKTYTYSIFAKAAGKRWVNFQTGSGGTIPRVWWNVSEGTLGTTNNESASITSVGNGWFRLSVTRVADGGYVPWVFCDDNASDTATINGNDGVIFWGAQVEERSQVTAYTPTTTQPITNYTPVLQTAPAGVPRFDHNPLTGESLGLLVEEQRTNLLTYSEQFGDAIWGKDAATVAVNAAVAPDGNLTADKLVENTATGTHRIIGGGALSLSSGTTYTVSIYAKAGERRYLMTNWNSAFNARSTFDLQTGTVASTFSGTATITSVGNGWYRCTVTGTATVNGIGTGYLHLNNSSISSDTSYTGDGYSGIYIWGAQLEAGAFPTSYIKTEASQVTRVADSAQMTGSNFSSWYRQDEGAMAVAFSRASSPTTSPGVTHVVAAIKGTSDNHILRVLPSGIDYLVYALGAYQVDTTTVPITDASAVSAGFSYKVNDFSFSAKSAIHTDLSGNLPTNVDRLVIGGQAAGTELSGHIRRITYYPKRLTDTQLQALTA